MSKTKGLLSSSIGRKIAMSLSALFLMVFLLQHLVINSLSVFSPSLFNEVSHFMGTNLLVQILLQPVLIFGVVFHFVMGFILQLKNNKARNHKYVSYSGADSGASWMSRNMIWSGLAILIFIVIHFIDFWFPEMNTKYLVGDRSGLLPNGEFRYYEELVHKFTHLWRVALYCLAFVFLSLHLMHGFASAFQSLGANHKLYKAMQGLGKAYAIIVPLGFILIALFHFLNH